VRTFAISGAGCSAATWPPPSRRRRACAAAPHAEAQGGRGPARRHGDEAGSDDPRARRTSRSWSCSTAQDCASANVAARRRRRRLRAARSPLSERCKSPRLPLGEPPGAQWPSTVRQARAALHPSAEAGSALFVNTRGRRMIPGRPPVLDRHPWPTVAPAPPRTSARLRTHLPRGERSQSGSGAARTRRCGNYTDLHSRDP